MRNLHEIRIREIVLHVLESRLRSLTLSDFPLQLEGNQPLIDYFSAHILNSLHEKITKAARFRAIVPSRASGLCADIHTGRISLVDGSRHLAQLLYEVMIADQKITPADLAVCTFESPSLPSTHYLALLKIDPSQVFRHEIIQEGQGRVRVNFQITTDKAFTKEKLQKCAFIRALEPRPSDYDMLLLDSQKSGLTAGEIAKFFIERFLEADEAYDPKSRTFLLYKTLLEAHRKIRQDLTPQENKELDTRISTAVSGHAIDTQQWAEEIPVAVHIQDHFKQALQEHLPDQVFEIDHDFARYLVEKYTFDGDNGLRVIIPAADYQHMIQQEGIETTPDGRIYKKIVIRTQKWDRVSR